MSALVAFVEVIVSVWLGGVVLVLAAGVLTHRPHRVTEWQAQCNSRPTSSTVDRVYGNGATVVVLSDERAARRS